MRAKPARSFAAVVAGLLAAAAAPALAQVKPETRPDRPSEAREQPPQPPQPAQPLPPESHAPRDFSREYREYRDAAGRHERLERAAYLGVATSPAPPVLRRQFGLPRGVGLVVDFVAPGSPAEQAGLKQFDVLHKLDDQILINPQQLAVLVRTYKAGDEVRFLVLRDAKPQTVPARLIEKDVPPLEDLRLGMNDPGGEAIPVPPGMPGVPGMPAPRAVDPTRPSSPAPRVGDPRFQYQPHPAGPGGLLGESGQVLWDDGDTQIALSWNGDRSEQGEHRTLFARDKTGKVLFEGPIDTPEQRRAIPGDLREKLRHMDPSLAPAPPAAGGPATSPSASPDEVHPGAHDAPR